VKKWQIFSCNIDNRKMDVNDNDYCKDHNIDNSPSLLLFYFGASDLADTKVAEVMMQNGDYDERDKIRTEALGLIASPTIRPINQWELFKNYRSYVPERYHAKLCPEPSKKSMDELKKDQENKAKKVRQPKRKVDDLSHEEVDEAVWRAVRQALHPDEPVLASHTK
jgi:hypothetical protein